MSLEEINKWLDNEYGISYTKLEELHDFYFEKYCDLQQENKKYKEVIDKAIETLDNYQNNLYSKSAREFLDDDIERTITILKEVE